MNTTDYISTSGPRITKTDPVYSENIADADVPGVVVVVDPEDADVLGAFEETALDEEAAWESNIDLGGDPQ
ncbi:MAG: hypothetical protein P8Y67_14215 [Alphaproteobacteria bacterium]